MAIEDSSPRPNADEQSKEAASALPNKGEGPVDPWERFMQMSSAGSLDSLLSLGEKEEKTETKADKKKRKPKRNWLRGTRVAEAEPVKVVEAGAVEPETKQPGFISALYEGLITGPASKEDEGSALPEKVVKNSAETPTVTAESIPELPAQEDTSAKLEEKSPQTIEHTVESNNQTKTHSVAEAEIPLVTNDTAESIHTILQRQQTGADLGGTGNLPPTYAEQVAKYGDNDSEKGATTVTNNYYERDRRTTGALVALDVLNYGVARRRDTKKEKAAIKRETKIKKTNEHQYEETKRQMSQHERYQEELQRRTEKLEKNHQAGPLPKVRQSEFRARGPEKSVNTNPTVVENTTNKTTLARRAETRELIAERPIVRSPDVALPSAEAILHKVEQAAEHNEAIETQYELRHERKGNTDFQALEDMSGSAAGFTPPVYSDSLSSPNLPASTSATPADRKEKQTSYKQAATTGVWGAVVGIVIFIVFYILTR